MDKDKLRFWQSLFLMSAFPLKADIKNIVFTA